MTGPDETPHTSDRIGTLTARANELLFALVEGIGSRPTGSEANQRGVEWFARTAREAGLVVSLDEFPALHWTHEGATLTGSNGDAFDLHPSPFSHPVVATANLVVVESIDALEAAGSLAGTFLLLAGDLASEQLFPRNFPFLTVEEHQRVYRALDAAAPMAVLTAMRRSAGMAGALYPAPLIEDGDFAIPVAHLSEEGGARLAACAGNGPLTLSIRSQRHPSTAANVVARCGETPAECVVLAHIDTKPTTAGALDNSTGIVTLLLLAELLRDAPPSLGVDLVAINGEDHYSNPGEVAFMRSHGESLPTLTLGINVDGVGATDGATAFSLYNMGADSDHAELGKRVRSCLAAQPEMVEGSEWIQGDHFIFAMNGVPSVAFTSEIIWERMSTVIHTADDTLNGVEPRHIARTALALHDLIVHLAG